VPATLNPGIKNGAISTAVFIAVPIILFSLLSES